MPWQEGGREGGRRRGREGGIGGWVDVTLESRPRQVWACVLDPGLPASCGGSGGGGGPAGAACYVFDEAAGRFHYWGPNDVLRLVQ